MPYACSFDTPADEQVYQRVKDEIGDNRPEGLVTHLVLKTGSGLRHIIVWSSQAGWERFRDEHVRPAVRKVIDRPLPPPDETQMQLVDVMTGG